MERKSDTLIYVGGPTALIEFAGIRFLTDPTFDPGGGAYPSGPVTLRKLSGPAISLKELGPFDYVLLSHDHHSDNLDHAGRQALTSAKTVFTTDEAAQRLGGNSAGLKPWAAVDVAGPDGQIVRVVATPARHGPAGLERGAVIGFVLFAVGDPGRVLYVSGDTVWYEGVAEVAQQFDVTTAVLHLGAARVPEVGPYHLTMTAREAVEAAQAFANAVIVPIHFEGWAHFSEGRNDIAREFDCACLPDRLRWPEPGRAIPIF